MKRAQGRKQAGKSHSNPASTATISLANLQAKLGETVPQLSALGLTDEQIDGLFQIINECVLA